MTDDSEPDGRRLSKIKLIRSRPGRPGPEATAAQTQLGRPGLAAARRASDRQTPPLVVAAHSAWQRIGKFPNRNRMIF